MRANRHSIPLNRCSWWILPNRRSIACFNHPHAIFLLRFRCSFSFISSPFLLWALSLPLLAPFHSKTLIHSSHLLIGVRSCFGTVYIFVSFVFLFHYWYFCHCHCAFFFSICWVLLSAFCSVNYGSIMFVLHWCCLVLIFAFW